MKVLQRHYKIPAEINKYGNCQSEKPSLFYLSIYLDKKTFNEMKKLAHKWQNLLSACNLQ